MALLLGIDLGTTFFKAGVFDAEGNLRGLGRHRVGAAEQAGRVELPVANFWRDLRAVVAGALNDGAVAPSDLAGVSYASQANSFVLLDRHEQPLTPIVLWPDIRGKVPPALAALAREPEYWQVTGVPALSAEFASAKLHWFQTHEPRLWAATHRVATLADYLAHALTGEWVIDASTAALLGLYDQPALRWWPRALAAAGVEATRLATPVTPGAVIGETGDAATEQLGLPKHIPVAAGGLDHQVAALGAGAAEPGCVATSTGTVLAALSTAAHFEAATGGFRLPPFAGSDACHLAFDARGTGELDTFLRTAAADRPMTELLAQADRAFRDGRHRSDEPVQTVLAHLRRIATTQAELVKRVCPAPAQVFATGGGARSWALVQMIANATAARVTVPSVSECGCLGAAMLASVAAGWHGSAAAASAALRRSLLQFEPASASGPTTSPTSHEYLLR